MADLLPISLLYLAVALLNQIIRTGATYVTEEARWRATNWLRNDLSRHYLRLDQAFHQENIPGTMIERLDSNVTALSNFFSQFVLLTYVFSKLHVRVLYGEVKVWQTCSHCRVYFNRQSLPIVTLLGRGTHEGAPIRSDG